MGKSKSLRAWLGLLLAVMLLASLVFPSAVPASPDALIAIGSDPAALNYTANIPPAADVSLAATAFPIIDVKPSANVTAGATTLTFSSPKGSQFVAGDVLWLRDDNTTTSRIGEVRTVASSTATVVTLTAAVTGSYTTTKNVRVTKTPASFVSGIPDVKLSLSASAGATTLSVTTPDGSLFAAGDVLWLRAGWDATSIGEAVKVASSTATTVTLTAPVTGSYTTGSVARVAKLPPTLEFTSPNASQFAAGDMLWVRDDVTTAGELVTVLAVTSPTRLTLKKGVASTYTTAQNARVSTAYTLEMQAFGVETAVGLAAYTIHIVFDPAVVDIVGFGGGTTPGFTSIFASNVNEDVNQGGIAHIVMAAEEYGFGDVDFARVYIISKGNAGDSATLSLNVDKFADGAGDPILYTTQNGTVNIIGASFTASPTKGAAPLTVQFSDTSTGDIGSWAWNFGDPASGASNTSTLQNPSHTYSSGGTYTVSLAGTWTTPAGFTHTATQTDYIKVIEAKFTGSPLIGTAPLTVQFTDQSTGPSDPSCRTWAWNFGDPASGANNTSTAQNPSHEYTAGGLYTVSLTVTCPVLGISDSETKTAYVNVVVANFTGTPTSGAASLTVQFADQSTGSPNTWAWNFGDPASGTSNTSTAQNPTHVYNTGGAYNVSLTATNSTTGASDGETKTAYIKVVDADFTAEPTQGMIPLTVQFTDTSTAPTGDTLHYEWDLDGDGVYDDSMVQNPTFEYTVQGDYTVSLRLHDANLGIYSTETKTAYIRAMSIVAETSLVEELLTPTGVVKVLVNIDRTKNPQTGLDQEAPGGIGAYQATVTYPIDKVSMKAPEGLAPFGPSAPSFSYNVMDASGQTLLAGLQLGSEPQAPLTLARLVPILNSRTDEVVQLSIAFTKIADAAGANIPEGDPSLSFRRGDANGDGSVDIVDALFIAQFTVNLRTAETLRLLNAASPAHEVSGGDKIDIVDALYIAQRSVLLRGPAFERLF